MLAKRGISEEFRNWNSRWGSPGGRRSLFGKYFPNSRLGIRGKGPFAYQPNSTTRRFEFPWAYHEVHALGPKLAIVEIGGGMSGLQYALSCEGHRVTNIDPGMKAKGLGFEVSQELHERICRAMNTSVSLRTTTIAEADIPSNTIDVVLCVSVLEHLTPDDVAEVAQHVPRILKSGGRLVLTVDLFLDLFPFTTQPRNRWGTNINVSDLVQAMGLELIKGTPAELFGFPDFSATRVLETLPEHLMGDAYPVLTQCVVAGKPTRPAVVQNSPTGGAKQLTGALA